MPRPLKHISETPQAIAIGNTRFRPITSKERKFVEKNKKYWTNQREWPIDYGKFDKHRWKETMEVIEETAIEYLWLNDNKSKQVLRCLVTPKFTHLTILNLNSNLLTSAQAICRIRAPCLQRLQLNDNQIADVRAFRKTCFRNLSWLSMFVNWSVLSELYAPHLERLSFQRKPFSFLDESVDWLLRMQSQQIKRVDALSFRRIPQQAVRSAISQRYSGLAMEWSTV